MYPSIDDLPFVCQLNLPVDAQRVYRTAFNRTWKRSAESSSRFQLSQESAWSEVRRRFERDPLTGRWIPKATTLRPRVSARKAAPRARKTAAEG